MSDFICPDCEKKKLSISVSLEIDSEDDDEKSFQLSKCSSCKLHALGYYTESRRGGGESWHHYAYKINEENFNELLGRVKLCNSRRNKRCKCNTHSWLMSSFSLSDYIKEDEHFFALRMKPLVLYDPNDPKDPNYKSYQKTIAKYDQDTCNLPWWRILLSKISGGK